MFDFKNVLNINNNLIQFLQENKILILCDFYKCKTLNFLKFILNLRVFTEKILNMDNLLVAANLNR